MITTLRRRLASEDGISMVEMLVALVVISVALFGLLGTLVASARSITDQRLRSTATRVATEHLETMRAAGFDALATTSGTPTTTTATKDGRAFTLETTITEEAAAPTGVIVPAGAPTVKTVRVVVRWQATGVARQAVFTTAVGPDDPTQVSASAAKAITGASANPNQVNVDAAGHPDQPILLTAILEGFDATALVTVTWVNDGGGTGSKTLVSGDGGVTWTGEIASSQITQPVPPGDSRSLEFTVTVEGLTRPVALTLNRASATAPVIESATIDRNPIVVRRNYGSCRGNQYCNNTTVTFAAVVSGIDTANDSVRVTYVLASGQSVETALSYDGASGTWRWVMPAGSTQLKHGTAQPFTFVALSAASGLSDSDVVTRTVSRVG